MVGIKRIRRRDNDLDFFFNEIFLHELIRSGNSIDDVD
jgi:hypothetical protein